jgi:hypothetical protein
MVILSIIILLYIHQQKENIKREIDMAEGDGETERKGDEKVVRKERMVSDTGGTRQRGHIFPSQKLLSVIDLFVKIIEAPAIT